MRIVNRNLETITEYDENNGRLVSRMILHKESAKPIDNITKFAWDPEDYEEVLMYIPNPKKTPKKQIEELKIELNSSDYKIIKCYECQLVNEELPYNIEELHTERQAIRDKINELEQQL